ncbi:U-box domain-containing protein 4 [Hordeum vulgare]|nr:U-box domain-containing protein 4 [Hordeum vulgare]
MLTDGILRRTDKGKEVVPPLLDVFVQDHTSAKRRNYEHYHEEARPTHFCKVIFAAKLEPLPLPMDFTKHFPTVLTEFSLKTNIGCSWRVTVKVINNRVTLDQGWATFAAVHEARFGYMATFKLLTPNSMKVTNFNGDAVEVFTKF